MASAVVKFIHSMHLLTGYYVPGFQEAGCRIGQEMVAIFKEYTVEWKDFLFISLPTYLLVLSLCFKATFSQLLLLLWYICKQDRGGVHSVTSMSFGQHRPRGR